MDGVSTYQVIIVPNTNGAPRYRRLTVSAYESCVAGALVMKIRDTKTAPVDMFPAMHVETGPTFSNKYGIALTSKLMSKTCE